MPFNRSWAAIHAVVARLKRRRDRLEGEAAERYRTLVDLAPDGIVVTEVTGVILFCNSALAHIVGAPDAASLIGRNELEFVHGDDVEMMRQRLAELAAGRTVPWMVKRWVRLDGTVIHVECAQVLITFGGSPRIEGLVREITGRVEAQATLDSSRRRLQAMFDTSLDAVLFFDSAGHYVDANPAAAKALGQTREEILQKSVGDFAATPQWRKVIVAAVQEAFARGSSSGEGAMVRRDGTPRWIAFRIRADVLEGLHIMVVRDLTEAKEAEGAMRQLSGRLFRVQDEERRRLGRQLHDTTGQNLAALRMNLMRIRRLPVSSDPAVAESLGESLALVDESIAEVRTLSYVLHPPLIDDAGLVAALRWYASGFEARSGIAVRLDVPDDLERLPRDVETTIFRIVQEALTNVQRHSGSRVARIRVTPGDDGVQVEISDEGKGIAAELRGQDEKLYASGVGMAGIRQRVIELGGKMDIIWGGVGMTILVELPTTPSA